MQFYRAFPIVRELAQLTWNHFRLLCQIDDADQREGLAQQAVKRDWTSPELEQRVRALNAAINIEAAPASTKSIHQPLVGQRGKTGVYRVAKIDGALVVDLGFANYFDLSDEQAATVKAGDLVTLDGNGRIAAAEGATKADLFNYRVELIKIVDGDTFWVKIYLRPRQWIKQKLRLRGLDCPESSTPEGQAAKRFVAAFFATATAITINTTKPDKYDRYLADVFLAGGAGQSAEASAKEDGIFLNNALLESGHAVRKDAWEFGDWEPGLV